MWVRRLYKNVLIHPCELRNEGRIRPPERLRGANAGRFSVPFESHIEYGAWRMLSELREVRLQHVVCPVSDSVPRRLYLHRPDHMGAERIQIAVLRCEIVVA